MANIELSHFEKFGGDIYAGPVLHTMTSGKEPINHQLQQLLMKVLDVINIDTINLNQLDMIVHLLNLNASDCLYQHEPCNFLPALV